MGQNNYRYFITFLFWTSLGTLYLAALSGPGVFNLMKIQLSTVLSPVTVSRTVPLDYTSPQYVIPYTEQDPSTTRDTTIPPLASLIDENLLHAPEGWHTRSMTLSTPEGNDRYQHPSATRNSDTWWNFLRFMYMLSSRTPPSSSHGHLATAAVVTEPHHDLDHPVRRRLPQLMPHKHSGLRGSARGEGGDIDGVDIHTGNAADRNEPYSPLWMIVVRPQLLRSVIDSFPRKHMYLLVTFSVAMGVHVGVVMLFLFHTYLGKEGYWILPALYLFDVIG